MLQFVALHMATSAGTRNCDSWKPVVGALRTLPNLKDVEVSGQVSPLHYWELPHSYFVDETDRCQRRFYIDDWEFLHFFARVKAAVRTFSLLPGRDDAGTTSEAPMDQWILALDSVRDRLDCLHYLLTQMDPTSLCKTFSE
eukprot:CAMPEP_0197449638 /NCGR_PEP_ID=MMETSP1175-20131217/22300_1 /TAXON_ID=1003142 /ORGANISM="Triceratium dubium, Strain CCMP147" /LENGTH=140 /DNA_ID=CAMNT_0042981831 /DNA_START=580 /DNA_END=1002 /DNA_ORIENTATION=-